MENMTLENITKACNGQFFGDTALLDSTISGVEKDSRLITEGMLYLPFVGQNVDGHDFIDQVFEKGALCTLSEKKLDGNHPYILVDSVNKALMDIAAFYRSTLKCTIIGITGSVGKTSTKEIIASVLSEKFKVLKTEGNYNNEIGMPLTILRIRPEHEVAVIEMGISGFGEMKRLSSVSRPNIAVITNIGTCHLENLVDRDGVFRAKTEMFENLVDNALVVLNGDDDKLVNAVNVNPVFFSADYDNDKAICKIKEYTTEGLNGVDVVIEYKNEEIQSHIPVSGKHMLYNAMAAVCIAKHLGLNNSQIDKGIRNLKTIGGRNNIIKTDALTIIDDCYNANPMSMKASIDVLSSAEGRKVAILGDMFELGDNEVSLHFDVGSYVGNSNIDVLVCIGKLAEHIADGAYSMNNNTLEIDHFSSIDEFMENCNDYLKEGDTVLVKASHGMNFKLIVYMLKNFKLG